MTIESVTTKLRDADRINELIYKARGIVEVIRSASSSTDQPPDDAVPGACWAVEDMLSEVANIIMRRF